MIVPCPIRDPKRQDFLKSQGWDHQPIRFLAGDCSFRRYYRLGSPSLGHVILMDAPPPEEDLKTFIDIDQILLGHGYSAPEIIAWHPDGFALIEDLGDQTFSKSLDQNVDIYTLYELATDVLIDLHKRFRPDEYPALPRYTKELYQREHDLFIDWYYPSVFHHPLDATGRTRWKEAWDEVLSFVLSQNTTLVLRDFHVDNLIYLPHRHGVQRCGLLDFQDAVIGPRTYDLVSLLEDARRDIPAALQTKMIERYLDAFPELSPEQFYKEYCSLGAQRTTKIFGIFTRLARRSRNPSPRYLPHIGRLWRLLDYDLQHPHLHPIKEWMNIYCPIEQRRVPDAD